MRRIVLTLSYDGTDFQGWQIQKKGRSVQGEIQKALVKLHQGDEIKLTGSGRTDSGVHATGQVAHFDTGLASIPSERFRDALNSLLSHDIRVLDSQLAPYPDFHTRFDAHRRMYKYYISNKEVCAAHVYNYTWLTRKTLDLAILNEMAEVITGIHDFTTFTSAQDQSKSRVREIFSAGFSREGEMIVFHIAGNAFLWKMVRSLTGTFLHYCDNGYKADKIKEILEARDRSLAGPTAPARGLFLTKVNYGSQNPFR